MAARPDPEYIRGVVDMGSNGIRLSLTDLTPPLTRILPTIYQARIPISLYDAQFPPSSSDPHQQQQHQGAASARHAIPESTTTTLLEHLLRFRSLCSALRVPSDNVVVLATEATRSAPGSAEFVGRVREATGWEVRLLSREEEARTGAYGVVSSLGTVRGLVMDLGGGSVQLSWVGDRGVLGGDGETVSLPYGAAALRRRLESGEDRAELEREVRARLAQAVDGLEGLRGSRDKVTLYLSGGGFRGWGYVLMNRSPVQPYPVPVINGFTVGRDEFLDTKGVLASVRQAADAQDGAAGLFRISDRRSDQVPAVAFLIKALADSIPQISDIRFCQGGVREGWLYASLPPEVQAQSPLVTATLPYATDPSSARAVTDILAGALPQGGQGQGRRRPAAALGDGPVLSALANTLHLHAGHVKDLRASSALRLTTTGQLAAAHGLTHEERALLALVLCERYGGVRELPPADGDFYHRLAASLPGDDDTRWFCAYLGRVAALVAAVWPVPGVGNEEWRVGCACRLVGEKLSLVVRLEATERFRSAGQDGSAAVWSAQTMERVVEEALDDIRKVGKRKNWIDGRHGYKVDVQLITTT